MKYLTHSLLCYWPMFIVYVALCCSHARCEDNGLVTTVKTHRRGHSQSTFRGTNLVYSMIEWGRSNDLHRVQRFVVGRQCVLFVRESAKGVDYVFSDGADLNVSIEGCKSPFNPGRIAVTTGSLEFLEVYESSNGELAPVVESRLLELKDDAARKAALAEDALGFVGSVVSNAAEKARQGQPGIRQGQSEKIENSHSPGAEEQDQSR